MSELFDKARKLLTEFKGDSYKFGIDVIGELGGMVAHFGDKAAVICGGGGKAWGDEIRSQITDSLRLAGVDIADGIIDGAKPNAPREDVLKLAMQILDRHADVVVAAGSGSTIDAVKAAIALAILGDDNPDLDDYFGVGKVTEMLKAQGDTFMPLVAVELAASSAAHLTKYSNVTDMKAHQKKLIVDEAVIPVKALFDYRHTVSMPASLTADGALDGVAHALEVLYGCKGDVLEKVRPVSLLAIELIVNNVKKAVENPEDLEAREALGLGTDLGGYAIMIGGTNGGHLTSFSLVDVLSHGRACAVMNPYYTVLFSEAIQPQLRDVGEIFRKAGYIASDLSKLSGRPLGMAVAEGMMNLSRSIGFPTTLSEVEGFTDEHITRALAAAKHPALEMKLQNMPIPLTAESVDQYMGSVLQGAVKGDLNRIEEFGDNS